MSPASSGNSNNSTTITTATPLEVEKYIGACLITQQGRAKANNNNNGARDVYFPRERCYNGDIYSGTFPGFPRWNVDTWAAGGLPLISFANHHRQQHRSASPAPHVEDHHHHHHHHLARLAVQGAPLILTKTYNRRNKGSQKPSRQFDHQRKVSSSQKYVVAEAVNDTISVTSDESSCSTNSDNCLPRIIKPRKRRKKDRKPQLMSASEMGGCSTDSSPDVVAAPFVNPFAFGIVPGSSFVEYEEIPKLHHRFEDVEECVDVNGNAAICQCRYCDPSRQIWDADRDRDNRDCYTLVPSGILPEIETLLGPPDEYLLHSMSSLSLDKAPPARRASPRSGDLEVSTEIVTSLNGHRDLEIKFFSSTDAPKIDKSRNCAECTFLSEE